MILHFLYTGSEKGGVQIWGKNLAKTVNTVVTCSFTAGAIERDYINKKLTFLHQLILLKLIFLIM